jgi:hypothetical protein
MYLQSRLANSERRGGRKGRNWWTLEVLTHYSGRESTTREAAFRCKQYSSASPLLHEDLMEGDWTGIDERGTAVGRWT